MCPSRDNRIENDRMSRRAARDASRPDLYEAPADSECDIETSEIWLNKSHHLRVVYAYQHRRLVRFFIAWMALDRDGEWSERYSVCTRHGHLHEHTTGHHRPDDRRDLRELRSQVDVQECHDEAYEKVHNRYVFATGGGQS